MMKTLTMHELYQRKDQIGSDELILDVRRPEEFVEGHVEGSRNISHEEVSKHLEDIKQFKSIFIYCRSGRRAQIVADELSQAGYDNTFCVNEGGMPDWIEKGYPFSQGN